MDERSLITTDTEDSSRRIDLAFDERAFLLRIFWLGLLLRVAVATFITLFDLEDFFGGDAATYDWVSWSIASYWRGESPFPFYPASQPGYYYFVAFFYYIFGHIPFLVVMINCCIGGLHAIFVYKIAALVFDRSVAKGAAWLTACFPSLVLWSAQLLKDPLIILCILISIYSVLMVHQKFNLAYTLLFIAAVLPLHPLRNYVFYIVSLSAVLSFIGSKRGPIVGLVMQSLVLFLLIIVVNSLGFLDSELQTLSVDNVLQQIHLSRTKMAAFARSGFAQEADVSTVSGALNFLPIGFLYLMLAPFPWNLTSVRSAITLPEMLLWWAMMPSLVRGVLFALRKRIAASSVILLFTGGLTVIYSLFQGNVGTAYRQRAQIIVFFLIFIVAGWQQKRRNRARISTD